MITGQEQRRGPDEYDLGNTFSPCVYTDGAKVDLIYSGQLFAPVKILEGRMIESMTGPRNWYRYKVWITRTALAG